jgi:hypothetical protein
MATKKSSNIPPEQLALYNKLVETNPDIERKGDNVPYTSCNGHMFSYLDKEGNLGLRLPKEEIGLFIEKYKTSLREAYGIIQKEYVEVPDLLFKSTKQLKPWFDKSYAYVKALKPKTTKKS